MSSIPPNNRIERMPRDTQSEVLAPEAMGFAHAEDVDDTTNHRLGTVGSGAAATFPTNGTFEATGLYEFTVALSADLPGTGATPVPNVYVKPGPASVAIANPATEGCFLAPTSVSRSFRLHLLVRDQKPQVKVAIHNPGAGEITVFARRLA